MRQEKEVLTEKRFKYATYLIVTRSLMCGKACTKFIFLKYT